MRSGRNVTRGQALTVTVDGQSIKAFRGETLAAAMLAGNARVFRLDTLGRPRGMFCNMGVCSECLVDIVGPDGVKRRLRACMTPVEPDMCVFTRKDGADG